MATVDNRIVEMKFDNAEFERRVSETIKTLAGLDKAIAGVGKESGLTEVAKQVSGFSTGTMVDALGNVSGKFLEIGKHASEFSTANMTSAIEGVSAKFIAMSAIAITALQNITNRVVDTGIQITKSLTIDQITGGFSEYELKLNAIQTIMGGTGESLDVVNKKLQELNTYSDQTIYSFADMTQNIGKFTNAGVDLDTAVASIKGIANVAAISGANAEEASRAMYNFAQALSKGHVELLDWKSIELANMATEGFKNQLLESAAAAGELTKQGDMYITGTGRAINATTEFNDSLTDAWLTTDVLNKTLGDYSDASTDIGRKATDAASDVKTFTQLMGTVKESIGSGWASTFEILLGNFDEAKWLFSGINDAIGDMVGKQATQRNELLQGWKDMGGWGTAIEGVFLLFKNVALILKPIKNAFRDIFPPMTSERLFELTEKFRDFAAALEPSGRTLVNIGHIFRGLFNVLDIAWELLKIGVGVVKDFVQELTGLGDEGGSGALQFFADIGKALEKLTVEDAVNAFKDGFEKIKDFIRSPIPVLQELWTKIKEFFSGFELPDAIKDAFSNLADRFGLLQTAMDKLKDLWKPISDAFGKIKDIFEDVKETISGFFDGVESGVKKASDDHDYSGVADAISVGLLGGILAGIVKLFKNGITIDFTGGLLGGLKDSLSELTGVLDGMQKKLKAEALKDIAIAIGILAAAVLVLSMIDAEDLAKAMTAMAVGFGQLIGVFEVIKKLDFTPSDTAKFIGLSVAFAALGVGALVLAAAAKVMSTLSWDEIARGLVGITGLLGALVAATKILKGDDLSKMGGEMIIIGGGLLVMGLAMKLFASMNMEEMGKGFLGVAGGLGAVIGAMKLMPDSMSKDAEDILIIAGAMVILAFAMKKMSEMSWTEIGKGLLGVGGGLGGIAIGLKKMPKNLNQTGFSILIISASLVILAEAMQRFADMSFGDILKSVGAIVGALIILSKAMESIEKSTKGSVAGGASFAIFVFSLGKLAEVLETFANLGLVTILEGLLGLAAAIGVLAGGSVLIAEALPFMEALGVALLMIGIGIAGIGFGANQLAKAFKTMGEAGPEAKDRMIDFLVAIGAAIPALMAGIARGLVEMGKVFLENIPFFVEVIGSLIVAILDKLTELIPVMVEFIIALVDAIIDLIVELTPKIVVAGWDLLLALLQGFADHIDEVIVLVGTFITNFLDGFTKVLPDTIMAVANFFIAVIEGVAEAVGKVAGSLMFGIGIAFITGFWDGMKDTLGKIWTFITDLVTGALDLVKSLFGIKSPSKKMMDIGIDVITGLLNGIVDAAVAVWNWFSELPGLVLGYFLDAADWLLDSGWNVITGLYTGITNFLTEKLIPALSGFGGKVVGWLGDALLWLVDVGWDAINGLYIGIGDYIKDSLIPALGKMGAKVIEWVGSALEWLKETGKDVIEGLWNGIASMGTWIKDLIVQFAKDYVLNPIKNFFGVKSPSKVFAEIGTYLVEGLNSGVQGMSKEAEQTSANLAKVVTAAFKPDADAMEAQTMTAVNAIIAALEADFETSPVITPVLDLSYIRAGASEMAGLLASSNYSTAAAIAGTSRADLTGDNPATAPAGLQFTQINNSPETLSTADIYRQTRNVLTLAKEELSIP